MNHSLEKNRYIPTENFLYRENRYSYFTPDTHRGMKATDSDEIISLASNRHRTQINNAFEALARNDEDHALKVIDNDPSIMGVREYKTGQSLLHRAINGGFNRVSHQLIEWATRHEPSLLNVVNNQSETPLMEATRQGNVALMQRLIKAGAHLGENITIEALVHKKLNCDITSSHPYAIASFLLKAQGDITKAFQIAITFKNHTAAKIYFEAGASTTNVIKSNNNNVSILFIHGWLRVDDLLEALKEAQKSKYPSQSDFLKQPHLYLRALDRIEENDKKSISRELRKCKAAGLSGFNFYINSLFRINTIENENQWGNYPIKEKQNPLVLTKIKDIFYEEIKTKLESVYIGDKISFVENFAKSYDVKKTTKDLIDAARQAPKGSKIISLPELKALLQSGFTPTKEILAGLFDKKFLFLDNNNNNTNEEKQILQILNFIINNHPSKFLDCLEEIYINGLDIINKKSRFPTGNSIIVKNESIAIECIKIIIKKALYEQCFKSHERDKILSYIETMHFFNIAAQSVLADKVGGPECIRPYLYKENTAAIHKLMLAKTPPESLFYDLSVSALINNDDETIHCIKFLREIGFSTKRTAENITKKVEEFELTLDQKGGESKTMTQLQIEHLYKIKRFIDFLDKTT